MDGATVAEQIVSRGQPRCFCFGFNLDGSKRPEWADAELLHHPRCPFFAAAAARHA